ncbi:MAG TPA: cyanophycinase [Gemmatimonadaceae bacterium]
MSNVRTSQRRRGDETGALILIGGACDPSGAALGTFLEMSGASDGAPIVLITTASTDPAKAAVAWKRDLESAGATNVEAPIIDRRERAQDPACAELVRTARGIFLGGGDQLKLVSTLGGSRTWRAVREAFGNGAIVCGTSAGAAALSETVLSGGEVTSAGSAIPLHLGPGLGLLGFSSVVDTHFARRGRLQRLIQQVALNPELLGIGIDENTGLVVRGHLAEVVGPGNVYYVDGRGARFDNADDVKSGRAALTLSYLRVGVVGAGYPLNLRERELDFLVEPGESRELR